MIAQQIQAHEVVNFEQLKALAAAEGPCISVTLSIPNPLELRARLKNMIRALGKELEERPAASDTLMEPIQELAATLEINREWANALVILRSAEVFQHYWLRTELRDSIEFGGRFQVRPLFERVAVEQCFHLLVLSQKDVQLRHVTPHRVEEIELRDIPRSFAEFLNTRQPDHRLENRSTNGPSVGSMKGAPFGTGTDREREDESLRHFFVRVNQGVKEQLRGNTDPMVLAAVDHDAALYRQINTYRRLVERDINGANFSEPDLLQRAWEAVRESRPEPLEKALSDFERHSNQKQVTTHPREAIKAAFDGRVADLYFTSTARLYGVCDEGTHRVRTGEGEDLVNAAALRTVLHGGRAFQLAPQDMPVKTDLVATLRF